MIASTKNAKSKNNPVFLYWMLDKPTNLDTNKVTSEDIVVLVAYYVCKSAGEYIRDETMLEGNVCFLVASSSMGTLHTVSLSFPQQKAA